MLEIIPQTSDAPQQSIFAMALSIQRKALQDFIKGNSPSTPDIAQDTPDEKTFREFAHHLHLLEYLESYLTPESTPKILHRQALDRTFNGSAKDFNIKKYAGTTFNTLVLGLSVSALMLIRDDLRAIKNMIEDIRSDVLSQSMG